ncbi:hypothetical protein HAX54_034973 [Datura stramonium]|uniref:Uncharacterized protein n=1 Tax=Datura stramonium TaxID=4076 RepID=A0ABS8VI13_DATST|nr:hypothetical protein [Datura stramonium]
MRCIAWHAAPDCEARFSNSCAMASHENKGKDVETSRKGFKSLRKGVPHSLPTQRAPLARRFGAQAIEEHGLKWFNAQKEAKYSLENWIDEGRLAMEFPTIHDTIYGLGLGYVLAKPEECNLALVRDFMPTGTRPTERAQRSK